MMGPTGYTTGTADTGPLSDTGTATTTTDRVMSLRETLLYHIVEDVAPEPTVETQSIKQWLESLFRRARRRKLRKAEGIVRIEYNTRAMPHEKAIYIRRKKRIA